MGKLTILFNKKKWTRLLDSKNSTTELKKIIWKQKIHKQYKNVKTIITPSYLI